MNNDIIDVVGYDSEDTATRILYVAMVTQRLDGTLAILTSDNVREHRLLYNSSALHNNRQLLEIDTTFKLQHISVHRSARLMAENANNGLLGIYMPDGVFIVLRDDVSKVERAGTARMRERKHKL